MEIDKDEDICPICGYEFAETKSSRMLYAGIAILMIVIFLWLILR